VGLVAPSQTVLVCDWLSGNSEDSVYYNYTWTNSIAADTGQSDEFRRHLGGDNFLFCDGHVKWLKPEMVKSRSGSSYAAACTAGNFASPTQTAYTFCPS
jgi:prepilin-type processing-associated H-X9-DG protein